MKKRETYGSPCIEKIGDDLYRCKIGKWIIKTATLPIHCPHPPRDRSGRLKPTHRVPRSGVGTELKKLLARFGIHEKGNCKCSSRAAKMDTNGIEWCESHVDEILGWLAEEAATRKLPFVHIAGKMLVKRAIRNARRAAATAT